jgi:hypothetical protein
MLSVSRVSAVGRQIDWILSRRWRRVKRCADLPAQANFVVVYIEHELSNTQVYPLHLYAQDIAQRHGARLSEIASPDFESDPDLTPRPQVEWLAFQTGFDLSDEQMDTLVAKLRTVFPAARLVYLDFFAPLDLRYAAVLDPWIDCYVKKQMFADPSQYGRTTVGDTNLTDYYACRYGIDKPQFRFAVPEGFPDKLVLGSNFCLSPQLIDRFRGRLPHGEKTIDVHARITTRGVDWYQRMREEAKQTALAVQGVRTVCEGRVSQAQFFDELAASKVCFSPFGYGEVCWRDYEAICCGAVLLKPRCDHLRLSPEIFVPEETYVPIEWDGSDYEDRLRGILADDKRRREMCANAFEVVRRYIREDAALDELAPVFEDVR